MVHAIDPSLHWLSHPLFKGCIGSKWNLYIGVRTATSRPHPRHIPATSLAASLAHPWQHPDLPGRALDVMRV